MKQSRNNTTNPISLKNTIPMRIPRGGRQPLLRKTPTVLSVIQSVSTGNPLSRQQIKFIEDNATLLIEFRPSDYCVKNQLTSRQELMMEHAAEALLIERAVAPIDAGHAFTTIGYSIANQNHFVEAKNRFLPKLFMIQDAIREKGLWPVWNLIKGEGEEGKRQLVAVDPVLCKKTDFL